jgi:hypothetical protein
MYKRIATFALAGIMASSSAFALKGNVHQCKFDVNRGEILAEDVLLVVSPDESAARVYDGIVHYVSGEPIAAKITENSAKKLTARWSVMMTFRGGTNARVDFRLSYFKGNKKANLSSQVVAFRNQSNARGTCTIQKGEL